MLLSTFNHLFTLRSLNSEWNKPIDNTPEWSAFHIANEDTKKYWNRFMGISKHTHNAVVTKKRGCMTLQQSGRSDVPKRNLVLCDPKTNQRIQIFSSKSAKTLLHTTIDHFT
jgi:hypothetical protein